MKKLLLFVVIGLVVLAVGANWYYTRQFRDHLDRIADMASMFGTLTYDNVRLSPGGAININDLSFRMHQGRGGVDIEQISLQTANLMALLTLEHDLERGRLPETLGLSVDNVQLPLDGALATTVREAPGNTSPTGGAGILFNAPGCDGRAHFTADDLMQMDYVDIRADLEARYQLAEGDGLRLLVSARHHDASAIHLEVVFDLPPGSVSTSDLAGSMQNPRLESFSMEYEDLGFYERMLAFCAEEMSLTESEYIAHHLEAWKQAWSRLNAEPGPDMMAAYESFLEDPQQFRIATGAEHSVSIEGIERYTLSELLERMDVHLAVNYGDPRPLDMTALGGTPERIAASEPAAGTEGTASSAEPEDAPTTVAADDKDLATEVDTADTTASTTEETTDRPTRRQWVKVDPEAIQTHHNQRVRIRMHSGDRHTGRLSRLDDDSIHIKVERIGGFYIRPFARRDIREMEVYERS